MKYYIIKAEKEELKIMKVKPEDEESFTEQYRQDILLSSESMGELMKSFQELLKKRYRDTIKKGK